MNHRRRPQRWNEKPSWKFEKDLVADFMALARRTGFRCYPETSNFDVLLVREDGFQVGVQAKLTSTVNVIAQAVIHPYAQRGPDVVAVLVPTPSNDFNTVCLAMNILVIDGRRVWRERDESEHRAARSSFAFQFEDHIRSMTPRVFKGGRVWFPPFEPDTDGGVPAPKSMTPWKLGAARICNILRARGYVTRADFKTLDVSIGWWTRKHFGVLEMFEKVGKELRYRLKEGAKHPDDEFTWVRDGLAREGVS